MSWSERYRAKQAALAVNIRNSVTPQKSVAAAGNAAAEAVQSVNSVHSVKVSKGADGAAAPLAAENKEHGAYEEAERAAIQTEPPLPPPGTPERDRAEREQSATVAGLLAAAAKRPVPCRRRALNRERHANPDNPHT